jgi:hypothetical protein
MTGLSDTFRSPWIPHAILPCSCLRLTIFRLGKDSDATSLTLTFSIVLGDVLGDSQLDHYDLKRLLFRNKKDTKKVDFFVNLV